MTTLGTSLTESAVKVMMLGSGELGKEVIIEFMRLGVEVIAVDRYPYAPGMQVAHRSYVINMLDEIFNFVSIVDVVIFPVFHPVIPLAKLPFCTS